MLLKGPEGAALSFGFWFVAGEAPFRVFRYAPSTAFRLARYKTK